MVCQLCDLTLPANRLKIHQKLYCDVSNPEYAKLREYRMKIEEKRTYPRPWTANMQQDHGDVDDEEEEEGGVEEVESPRAE